MRSVLLVGCDKTIPAALMGATSVDLPTIVVTGGPTQPGLFLRSPNRRRDRPLALHGRVSSRPDDAGEYAELESALVPSTGHCAEMGTASTMSALCEALGLALPGSAAIPAVDARRMAFAEATGRRAVEMARWVSDHRQILTPEAFDNAITLLMALGGSTNAVVHLLALAGRAGVDLSLARFDELSRRTPMIVNVRPSGEHLVEQLFHAGGVPAVMNELRPLLHWEAPTVTGRTVGDNVGSAKVTHSAVISTLAKPFQPEGGIVVLSGNLAPRGAVLKRSAASQSLLHHRGRALVFQDIDDLASRVDDESLDVTAESVMILKNAGPQGAPGMPEWGQLPIPKKLLRVGVSDLVRISDARMSGTSFGTVILHVSPESAIGGPLGLVEDGDEIELDVDGRKLTVLVEDRVLSARAERFHKPEQKYRRGYGKLFLDHVLQADEGCDFDFLRKLPGEPFQTDPIGTRWRRDRILSCNESACRLRIPPKRCSELDSASVRCGSVVLDSGVRSPVCRKLGSASTRAQASGGLAEDHIAPARAWGLTTAAGISPRQASRRLRTAISAMRRRVSTVALPICGVITTLSRVSSGFVAAGGSTSITSMPAPAIRPDRTASKSAVSSTTAPRDRLTK